MRVYLFIVFILTLLLWSCKKETPRPTSLNDTTVYQDDFKHIRDSLVSKRWLDSVLRAHNQDTFTSRVYPIMDSLIGTYLVSGTQYTWNIYSDTTYVITNALMVLTRRQDTMEVTISPLGFFPDAYYYQTFYDGLINQSYYVLNAHDQTRLQIKFYQRAIDSIYISSIPYHGMGGYGDLELAGRRQ